MQRESEEVWWGSASSSPRSRDLAAPPAKSTLHPSPDPPTDHFLPDLSGFFFFPAVPLDVTPLAALGGVLLSVLIILLIIWLVRWKKQKKKYEEEETPNEIRYEQQQQQPYSRARCNDATSAN